MLTGTQDALSSCTSTTTGRSCRVVEQSAIALPTVPDDRRLLPFVGVTVRLGRPCSWLDRIRLPGEQIDIGARQYRLGQNCLNYSFVLFFAP